jgi:hypothetical protein
MVLTTNQITNAPTKSQTHIPVKYTLSDRNRFLNKSSKIKIANMFRKELYSLLSTLRKEKVSLAGIKLKDQGMNELTFSDHLS